MVRIALLPSWHGETAWHAAVAMDNKVVVMKTTEMGLSESITAPYAVVALQMRRRRSGKRKRKKRRGRTKRRGRSSRSRPCLEVTSVYNQSTLQHTHHVLSDSHIHHIAMVPMTSVSIWQQYLIVFCEQHALAVWPAASGCTLCRILFQAYKCMASATCAPLQSCCNLASQTCQCTISVSMLSAKLDLSMPPLTLSRWFFHEFVTAHSKSAQLFQSYSDESWKKASLQHMWAGSEGVLVHTSKHLSVQTFAVLFLTCAKCLLNSATVFLGSCFNVQK